METLSLTRRAGEADDGYAPTPADLRARVLAAVEAASPAELPALAALGEELRVAAGARLAALSVRCDPAQAQDTADRLLTCAQVAERLAVPEHRVYELLRQGALEVVRLPGLQKAGRQREGKNVRVRLGALTDWMRRHEHPAARTPIPARLISSGERR